jgi:hypothetical protein
VALNFRDGNVVVALDGDLERWAREATDQALPGVLVAMEAKIGQTLAEAVAVWPVRTGRSKEGLKLYSEIGTSEVRVQIRTAVPYTYYIKPKSLHGATTAWQRWVRGPITRDRKILGELLGPVIVDAIQRSARRVT